MKDMRYWIFSSILPHFGRPDMNGEEVVVYAPPRPLPTKRYNTSLNAWVEIPFRWNKDSQGWEEDEAQNKSFVGQPRLQKKRDGGFSPPNA